MDTAVANPTSIHVHVEAERNVTLPISKAQEDMGKVTLQLQVAEQTEG